MFKLSPVKRRRDFFKTYANNYIAIKVGILMESYWILGGSGREKKINVSILLIIFPIAVSHSLKESFLNFGKEKHF